MTKTKRRNYWIIDRDLQPMEGEPEGTNCNAKGVMGPRGCPDDAKALTLRFRLLCDGDSEGQHEVLYEGRMLPWDEQDDDSDGFEPLDNFGRPNAGCTELQYWQPGKGGGWKFL